MKKLTILALSLSLVLGACGGGGGGSDGGDGSFIGAGNQNAGKGVSKDGADVMVLDTNSPIYGTRVTIPKDAITNGAIDLGVAFSDSLPGALNPKTLASGIVVASKVITITKNRPGVFDKPIEIRLPYDPKKIQANSIPVVLAWDANSKSYQTSTIVEYDAKAGFVTVQTVNLTSLVVVGINANVAVKQFSSQQVNTQATPQAVLESVDTGFLPQRDGFFVPDATTTVFSNASPAGSLAYAKWYFLNKKGPKGLYFDYREGSLDLAFDDNTAYEIVDRANALLTQKDLQTNWKRATEFTNAAGFKEAVRVLVSVMRGFQEPQLIMLQLEEKNPDGANVYRPLLVYKFDGATNTFYAYDTRYPGKAQTFQYDAIAGTFTNFSFPSSKVKGFGFISTDTLADSYTINELYEGAKAGWAESKYGKINLVSPNVTLQNGSYITSVADFKNVQFTGSLSRIADTMAIRLNGQNSFSLPVNNKQFNFNTSSFATWWPSIDMNANQENEIVLVDQATTIDRDFIGKRVGFVYGAFKKIVLTNSTTVKFQNGDFELGDSATCVPVPAPDFWGGKEGFACKKYKTSALLNFGYPNISGYSHDGIQSIVDSYSYYNNNSKYAQNSIVITPPSGSYMGVHNAPNSHIGTLLPVSIPAGATRISFDFNRIEKLSSNPANLDTSYNSKVVVAVYDVKDSNPLEPFECFMNEIKLGTPCRYNIYKFNLNGTVVNKPVHSDAKVQAADKIFQTGWIHVDAALPAGLNHNMIMISISTGGRPWDHERTPFLIDNIQFK